ncbi:Chitin synthase export chaperone [Astathelohania contejeani]|uniref:Chitin synthase export chaperone n=1 Tax=Astathelohania contejeani TaxID=164912 RepID=A0ABQ7HXT6_9MICR|nr:Chitin synthase export chaperone [Thelohania contejeani]
MDILNMTQTCKEMDLPICRVLKNSVPLYTARPLEILSLRIYSPATILLLCFTIISTLWIIPKVNKHYSAIGRKELMMFFYLYIISAMLEMVLISNLLDSVNSGLIIYLISLQISFANSAFFCLFVGAVTANIFLGGVGIASLVIVRIATAIYFLVSLAVIFSSLIEKNSIIIFGATFIVNGMFAIAYVLVQSLRLINMDAEVWAYGTLGIAFLFFCLGVIPMFYGSKYIAYVSERYLDGVFFFHLFIFSSILMIHKFWLSTCENEAECTDLWM